MTPFRAGVGADCQGPWCGAGHGHLGVGAQARAGCCNHPQCVQGREQLEGFRSEQEAIRKQKSYESGFSFPEGGGQIQQWLELGSEMKQATSALLQEGEMSWGPQSTRLSYLRQNWAVWSVIMVQLGTQGCIKCNCSAVLAAVAGHCRFAPTFLLWNSNRRTVQTAMPAVQYILLCDKSFSPIAQVLKKETEAQNSQ